MRSFGEVEGDDLMNLFWKRVEMVEVTSISRFEIGKTRARNRSMVVVWRLRMVE